jgi:hypothetical protein
MSSNDVRHSSNCFAIDKFQFKIFAEILKFAENKIQTFKEGT